MYLDRCARRGDPAARNLGGPGHCWSFGGEAALSVEARYLEPDLPEELAKAYAQTFARLRRMFRARGCTAEEAADLAQEAAVRAFMHVRRWGVTGVGLDPLLNRIARNLLIDRYRRTTPHIVPLDDAGELHDPDQDPTEEVVRRQRRRAVHTAISALPVRHRDAITYSLNGMSPEEVGRRMGIGRNAADALLHRARRSLKERLQTTGEGMFGVALGVRLRVQRLFGREDQPPASGGWLAQALNSSFAAVTSVALATTLGVVSPNGVADRASAAAVGMAQRPAATVAQEVAPITGSSDAGETAASTAPTYQLGRNVTATWQRGEGYHTRTSIPAAGDKDKELLGLGVGIEPEENGGPVESEMEQGVDQLCDRFPVVCRSPLERAGKP